MATRQTFFEPPTQEALSIRLTPTETPTVFMAVQQEQSNKAVLDEYIALNAKWKDIQDYETLSLPLLGVIPAIGFSLFPAGLIVGLSLVISISLGIGAYKAYCLYQEYKLIKKSMEHATDEDKHIAKKYYLLTALQQVGLTFLNVAGVLLFFGSAFLWSPLVYPAIGMIIAGLAIWAFSSLLSFSSLIMEKRVSAKNNPYHTAPHPEWLSREKGKAQQAAVSATPMYWPGIVFCMAIWMLGIFSSPLAPLAAAGLWVPGLLGVAITSVGWVSTSHKAHNRKLCNARDPVFWLLENKNKISCVQKEEKTEDIATTVDTTASTLS